MGATGVPPRNGDDSNSKQTDTGRNAAQHGTPQAGQIMGFAGQLRSWRKAEGKRRGRRVTQGECATAVGRSERWWRDLERGDGRNRLDREQCDALAQLLQLDRDEYIALLLYNNLGTSATAANGSNADPRVRSGLRLLIDKQMPSPTYLCDANWNILGYNAAMAEWFPWVLQPGANLIRWALTSPEARVQYHDWNRHAVEYVRLLKFALAGRGDSAELMQLIGAVCKDPDVQYIWENCAELTENRDGHIFRMSIPCMDWEPIDVVSHVLYPAALPDCRLVVITWWAKEEGEEEAPQHVESVLGAPDAQAQVEQAPKAAPAAERRRIAQAVTGRISVPTAEAAAALAGDDAVPLPVLSSLMGEDCQLTLSPSAQTVIWAVQEEDGAWSVSEVSVYTAIVRLPHAATAPEAREEMKVLVRANLPEEPKKASDRIQELLPQLHSRIHVLEQIARDLHEQDPTLPYVWDPTDEI
ncbi:helix-turn-helix transcriptional regulator [Streptomyces sp. bgisy060]|uniref:helix-turn-helix transcriptional regulator n=1 Tax=Streptomyces sp. bgisy060 TaxID=3413775 RepID=UPI003EBD0434